MPGALWYTVCFITSSWLFNDPPNGEVNGKCGWIPVRHWNLCGGRCANTSKQPFPLFMFVEGEQKQDDIRLQPVFVLNKEPAHLLSHRMTVRSNCDWLINYSRWRFFFPQQMDLLRQDKKSASRPSSSSSSSSSGLTGLSCLVIAAPVLFAGPRWNVITAFGEYD